MHFRWKHAPNCSRWNGHWILDKSCWAGWSGATWPQSHPSLWASLTTFSVTAVWAGPPAAIRGPYICYWLTVVRVICDSIKHTSQSLRQSLRQMDRDTQHSRSQSCKTYFGVEISLRLKMISYLSAVIRTSKERRWSAAGKIELLDFTFASSSENKTMHFQIPKVKSKNYATGL